MIYVLSSGNFIKLLLCHHADAVAQHPKFIAGICTFCSLCDFYFMQRAKKKNKRGYEFLCAFAIS